MHPPKGGYGSSALVFQRDRLFLVRVRTRFFQTSPVVGALVAKLVASMWSCAWCQGVSLPPAHLSGKKWVWVQETS